ncbi:MAG: hypothetical protein WBP79_05995 [Candidatus Acidiferrales bacterium]
MIIIRKAANTLAGIFLAVLLIGALAPKATRGVVAAFVQVVNTPTSAIPVVQAPPASELYASDCEGAFINNASVCEFTMVPLGKTLVAESISVSSTSPIGIDPTGALVRPTSGSLHIWIPLIQQAPNLGTGFNSYMGSSAGRVAFVGGTVPLCVVEVYPFDTTGSGGTDCAMYGYLVPAS